MTEASSERSALASLHAFAAAGGLSEDEAAEGLALGAILVDVAHRQQLPLTRPAAWGILPIAEVDALAVRLPDGQLAAVVTRGLRHFSHAMFAAVTAFVPVGETPGTFDASWSAIEREMDERDGRHTAFVEALRQGGEAPFVDATPLTAVLARGADLFALAVPLVVARIEPALDGTIDEMAGDGLARVPLPPAAQAVADVIALRLAEGVAANEGRDVSLALAAIDLHLAGLGLLALANGAPEDVAATPRHRRATLRQALARHAPDEAADMLALADTLHRLLVELMQRNARALERHRSQRRGIVW